MLISSPNPIGIVKRYQRATSLTNIYFAFLYPNNSNFYRCQPFADLIRKGKAEHSSTNSSVSKGRHSRTLMQQGAFLNAKNSLKKI